ncbi:MAG: O-antigen ligase [Parcubacteria bacterium C7867-001]|nr:MAG: O-antigen ligase [Parcubacteria bacterium C7867-001]
MKTALRWAIYIPLFAIPFLSLIVFGSPLLPTFYFPFITGKGFLFRILVEVAVTAYVLLAVLDKKYRPQFSWTFVLYSAFAVWMLIADLLAENPHKALWSNFERMDGFVTLIHLYGFFLVAGTVLTVDKLWRKWWLTFLSAVSLVLFYALLQVGGGLAIHQGSTRVDATLGNAAYLAAYLLFAIAVSLWQALESKGAMRYTLFALTAVEVFILFATATRGAILGLVGAAILGAGLWVLESKQKARKSAGIVLGVLLVLVAGFFALKDTSFIKNDPVLGRIASISLNDGSTRFAIWDIAWQGFLERPVFGWGQEGFNYVFNSHYNPALYAQEQWFDRAHDVFLDWLIAGGLPALLLFLALLGSAVFTLYRGGASKAERVMLTSALAAYAFQSIFVFDNLFTYIPLAALLACAHAAAARPIKKLEALPEPKGVNATTPIVVVGAIAGLLIVWFVNVPAMATAGTLIKALTPQQDLSKNLALFKEAVGNNSFATQEVREQILSFATAVVQSNASNELKNEFAVYGIDQMNQELQRAPKDARLHMQQAIAYRSFGAIPNAANEFETALSLSPNKVSLFIEYGVTAWTGGNTAVADQAFTKAYSLAPQFPQLAAYVAAGRIVTGKTQEGEKFLLDAYGTTAVNSDILIASYYETKQYAKMIGPLEQKIKEDGGSAVARFSLAQVYALNGRYAEAKAQVEMAIKDHPEAAAQGAGLLQQLGIK